MIERSYLILQPLPNYVMAGGKPVDDGRERTWQLLRGRQGSKENGKVLAAAVDILSVRDRLSCSIE